jgi:Methyltransferase domain
MATLERRSLLTRHLIGSGIEIGPAHSPLVESKCGLAVRYVDRWEPDHSSELFPELEGVTFLKPDLVVDLNRDALEPVASQSEDFVVCSHVLEHLANPLRVINDFHRVLRRGGALLILLPDRRRTFDKHRPPTSLGHVVSDFEAGVVEVDDEHIMEFLANTPGDAETLRAMQSDLQLRAAHIELHRKRSIHVHCWTLDQFVLVIKYSIEVLGNRWQFVDGFTTEEQGKGATEFGLVLRRAHTDLPSPDIAKLFSESFDQWLAARPRGLSRDIEALLASRTFRQASRLRHFYAQVRRTLARE